MKNSELLATQSNVEENNSSNSGNKNTELIQRWRVYNTPFTVIHNEQGWFTVMGEYRLTELFENEDELLQFTGIKKQPDVEEHFTEETGEYKTHKYYSAQDYAFLTSVISAMIDLTLKLKGDK